MTTLQNLSLLIVRLTTAILYVLAGLGGLFSFNGAQAYLISKGLPFPAIVASIAIVVELVAGMCLAVGYKTRASASTLIVYTLLASFFFHNFWSGSTALDIENQIMFFKNMAIVGGLLHLVNFGAGVYSFDAKFC